MKSDGSCAQVGYLYTLMRLLANQIRVMSLRTNRKAVTSLLNEMYGSDQRQVSDNLDMMIAHSFHKIINVHKVDRAHTDSFSDMTQGFQITQI